MKKTVNILTLFLLLQSPVFAADNGNVKEILITENGSYHRTVSLWKTVYYELTINDVAVRGATFIAPIRGNGYRDRQHKNKARDTIIFVPSKIDFDKSIDVIFFFHGLGGFKNRDFKTRVLRHTKSFYQRKKNFIIVVPEMPWSKNTSTPRSRQGNVFTQRYQFATFIDSVIKTTVALFEPSPVKRMNCIKYNMCQFNFGNAFLVGHSAGGSTLMSISRSGGLDWLYKKIDTNGTIKVIFSDASYGRWLNITWKYFKAKINPQRVEFIILTRKHDKPYHHTIRFLKKIRLRPINLRHIVFNRKENTHGDIGDEALIWVYKHEDSGCGEGDER